MRSKNSDSLINYRDIEQKITVTFKRPSMLYLNEFLRLKCAPDLISWGVYPNVKEISESSAAYEAVRKELGEEKLKDPKVIVYCVGDGRTPRTAAMFAVRSNWHCISVDPNLKRKELFETKIRRLRVWPYKIEDLKEGWGRLNDYTRVVVAVHSHAKLDDCARCQPHLVVAIPCCIPQTYEGREPDKVYSDWGILSPERTVKVWRCKP